jgi:hypothetical protein
MISPGARTEKADPDVIAQIGLEAFHRRGERGGVFRLEKVEARETE